MERQMIGITLGDRKHNIWIRNQTNIIDVTEQKPKLKFAGYNEREQGERWNRVKVRARRQQL